MGETAGTIAPDVSLAARKYHARRRQAVRVRPLVAERTVHVHRGHKQHRRADDYRTVCGNWWVATIVGPPATENPLCPECFA